MNIEGAMINFGRFISSVFVGGSFLLTGCGSGSADMQNGTGPNMTPRALEPLFVNVPLPVASELVGMYSWARPTSADFNSANLAPETVPNLSKASFDGNFLARKGTGAEFIDGDLDLTIDFIAQSGSGTIKSVSISGDDATNHQYSLFDPLDVLITDVNGARMQGTVTGSLPRGVTFTTVEGITVDAALQASLIDQAGSLGVVGIVNGTVLSTTKGTQQLSGVIVGSRDPFE